MWEAMSGESFGRPASVLQGKPHEEFYAKGSPRLPREPPAVVLTSAEEKCLVTRTGRVGGRRGPAPFEGVGGVRERDLTDATLEVDVLDESSGA